ncbi:MAG: RNA-splicing ligase RtcB [Ectothiorhodospiraceae bacterium]|nr:RNA-splicing ligase RtcB [Ectothiorhodospiraceae bacterium]
MSDTVRINKIDDFTWEIPKTGSMQVPGKVYASDAMMKVIRQDQSLQQVANVAHLPGIVKQSLAMPDIHWGYGFPIGGVCATDEHEGVISPGGVGYDINCGVRLVGTKLKHADIAPRMKALVKGLFDNVPTGVGASKAIEKLSRDELKKVAREGAGWAVKRGFGSKSDLDRIEENGCIQDADPGAVDNRPWERGAEQVGTLGSGNHFLEIGRVEEIYNNEAARAFGLEEDGIVVLIHCGSRGFGYQICDDYLKVTLKATEKYNISLPDRQLACAPLKSSEGKSYIGAMRCAANYAFANRQVIMSLANDAFRDALAVSESDVGFNLIYDICHNIAKYETHCVDGEDRRVCMHRKGATRAFGPDSAHIPDAYKPHGQPVLIPGDMGRYSYLCVGTERAMEETFGSSCHGAGRHMSRRKAMKASKGRDMIQELNDAGVEIMATGKRTIAEEMPHAYKDVADVVDVMHNAGITRKVARFKPVGVIKG